MSSKSCETQDSVETSVFPSHFEQRNKKYLGVIFFFWNLAWFIITLLTKKDVTKRKSNYPSQFVLCNCSAKIDWRRRDNKEDGLLQDGGRHLHFPFIPNYFPSSIIQASISFAPTGIILARLFPSNASGKLHLHVPNINKIKGKYLVSTHMTFIPI